VPERRDVLSALALFAICWLAVIGLVTVIVLLVEWLT
jgi:hypothetical protein